MWAGVETSCQVAPESAERQISPLALSTDAYTVPGRERAKAISMRAELLRPEGTGTSAAVRDQERPPSREKATKPLSSPATALDGSLGSKAMSSAFSADTRVHEAPPSAVR